MRIFSKFQKYPKFWACVATSLAVFEVYLLSAAFLQGDFGSFSILQRAYIIAVIPTFVVCAAFFYFVYLSLTMPVSEVSPFSGIAKKQKQTLKIAFRTLGTYFAFLIGMCATLFLCEDNGPWHHLLDGITGPNLGLSNTLWPVVFLLGFCMTLFGVERLIKPIAKGAE